MRISDIKSKFEAIQNENDGINSFVFDDYSVINTFMDTDFPALLLKIPTESDIEDINKDWRNYKVQFFIFDARPQTESRAIADHYDDLEELCEEVTKDLRANKQEYQIRSAHYVYGHDEGTNSCIFVGATIDLRTFQCRIEDDASFMMLETGDYILLENGDYLQTG